MAPPTWDATELADRKQRRGERLSVVIPARNEEATVGGLVDEVLVVDADSSDRTAERAAAAGARVVRQSDVLAEHGSVIGKGEAMWKGLAASTGELVVFVDADILDVDDRFVTGLVAPLLTDPDIALVKAAYDRPLRTGEVVAPVGGGRVTELLARPLIASLWPELAWVSQPLAGEIAARRYLLERACDRQVALMGDGRLRDLPGGVEQYLELRHRQGEPPPLAGPPVASGASADAVGDAPSPAEVREARKEMARIERQLSRLAEREGRLHDAMAAAATDHAKVLELNGQLREIVDDRESLELAWLEAAETAG